VDFNLSEDHEILSNTLRRFLSDNTSVEGRNESAFDAPYHSPDLWMALCELGIAGAFVSEDQGGFGGSAQDIAVIFEELGGALCVEPALGTLMAARLLAEAGREDIVEQLIAGEARAALAVYEPELACALTPMATVAAEQGGGWVLTGRKSAIYGAPGARYLVVAAKTGAGIGLFLLEDPQIIAAAMADGGGIGELVLDNTPAERLSDIAGPELEQALDLGRIALCAEAVGAMSSLVDMTVDYLNQRKQFGKALSSFQALQHRVVDMQMELEQCRSILISAVAHYGTPEAPRHVSMAKNLVGRAGRKIAEDSIQLHGGIGMTWEYPGTHFAKRLVMIDHQLGDQSDHLMRIMSGTAA
jgi:alkylation response protein AidB-like acyl-CoA dehydrogenase